MGPQVGDVALPVDAREVRHVALERQRATARLDHVVFQAVVGVIRVAEQLGDLLAQLENADDQRAVVELAVPAARHVRMMDGAAQVAVVRVLEDRLHGRMVEGEKTAREPLGGRGVPEAGDVRSRDAVQAAPVDHVELPRGGRIQHILAELLLRLNQLDLELLQPGLVPGREVRARAPELEQGLVQMAAPDPLQPARLRGRGEGLHPIPERGVQGQSGPERRYLGEDGVVGVAQRPGLVHGEQVADRLDALVHPARDPVQLLERARPGGRAPIRSEGVDPLLADAQQLAHARLDVLGADAVKRDGVALREERIGFGHISLETPGRGSAGPERSPRWEGRAKASPRRTSRPGRQVASSASVPP